MEIWDAYFSDGTPAGRDLVRDEPIPHGLYHLVSEILVRHADGDYLLMQRDTTKPNYGGRFEATAAGSALKGESNFDCAKRELFEETGVRSKHLTEIAHYVSHNTIYCIYLCITDCNKSSVTLQEGETISYKWVSENDFISFINSTEMIEAQKLRYHEYFKKIGYLIK